MKIAILFLLAVLLGGCFSKPAPKSYVAVVAATAGSHGTESKTSIWGKKDVEIYALNVKTPSDVFFTIRFRMNSSFQFPSNTLGELRYHACGDDLYCFDSFSTKH